MTNVDSTGKKCVYDPLAVFVDYYSKPKGHTSEPIDRELPVDERLKKRIIDGNKNGILEDLDAAREDSSPIAIINEVLLPAMKEVGDLFSSGQMQLPFVLQSAETMNIAVTYLQRCMEKTTEIHKATIILATVKDDVHDIGKNLVDIILRNNGYKVVNLGVRIPLEVIIAAAEEHNADAIGMSGLLVKSTLIMKENLQVLRHRGIRIPVIVGGASLTRKYVEEELQPVYDGEVVYAADAFTALSFLSQLEKRKTDCRANLMCEKGNRVSRSQDETAENPAESFSGTAVACCLHRSFLQTAVQIPVPPFLGSKADSDVPVELVLDYLQPESLINTKWKFSRKNMNDIDFGKLIDTEVSPKLSELKDRIVREGILRPAIVYGYFPCNSDGDDLIIFKPKGIIRKSTIENIWPRNRYAKDEITEWLRFRFPRRHEARTPCLADFFSPLSGNDIDICVFMIVTAGGQVIEHLAHLFKQHRYEEYFLMHGVSAAFVEALAECQHRKILNELGMVFQESSDHIERRSKGYQRDRFSFGYPACPCLEDQKKLFELLHPDRIGITLTENCQLVPEYSMSALIVHQPRAKFFPAK